MKNLAILFMLVVCNACLAQEVETRDMNNDVLVLSTTNEEFGFKEGTKYCLNLMTDGTNTEYAIGVETHKNIAHAFPDHAVLLLRLADGSVVELKALFSVAGEMDQKVKAVAFYPITPEQIASVSCGVTKVRVELYSVDKNDDPFMDYQEKEYKKDKIGKIIGKMKDVLDNDLQNILDKQKNNQEAVKRTDASAGF